MQQRAQSNRIGYTVVTQWLQHRLHWTRAATTQTKAADKPPTLDTRSNNTDKSGRQTANAGHAQQQHRQKRQTNRQRNKTHAATTRTAVCCSFCPPKNVYNSVFASRACNHYTVETRAKSFARRSFRLAYRQFFGRSLRRDELAMSALHQSRIAIQSFSSAAKIGLKILMMAAAS